MRSWVTGLSSREVSSDADASGDSVSSVTTWLGELAAASPPDKRTPARPTTTRNNRIAGPRCMGALVQ